MTRFLSYTLCAMGLLFPLKVQADVQPNSSLAIDLPINDVVYDSINAKLYASVGPNAGTRSNTVTAIDPLSGQIGTSVYVGVNPGRLALAPGGAALYVATTNSTRVERINLSTGLVNLRWSLGSGRFGDQLRVDDMEVVPGKDDTVAISLANTGYSPRHEGVAIYTHGVKRPNQTPSHTGSNVIEFADSSTLWGYNNETTDFGLRRMSVNNSGVTVVEERSVFYGFGNDFRYTSGRFFDTTGQIASGQGVLQGHIPNVSGLPVVKGARVFYCANGLLSAFDLDTLRLVGTFNVDSGNKLVSWGNDGFAWRRSGDNKLVIARSDLANVTSPTPLPMPTPRTVRQGLRIWDVTANDLMWDGVRKRLLISTPSGLENGNGNSIVPLDPITGTSATSIYVGSEPRQMALSDDGKTLYVALNGSGEVRRVDLATAQAGIRWSLGSSWLGGALYADDLEVVPGSPNRVVVSRRNMNYSPRHEGVALYEDGVQTGDITHVHSGSNVIEFGDGGVLWGGNNESSEYGLRKMTVASSGVTLQSFKWSVFGSYGFDIEFAAGKIYASNGSVIEPETATRVGTFSAGAICTDVASGRLFVLKERGYDSTPASILIYDLKSLQLLDTISLPEIRGSVSSLVRWGDTGLAFRTESSFISGGSSSVVLVENALVAPRQSLGLSLRYVALKEKAGPNATTATVSRSADFANALEVSLQSDLPALVVPPTVTIPAGAKSVTFNVGVADDTRITGTQNVTLTAFARNYKSAQKSVRVFDDEAILRLSVTPGVFVENVGNKAVRATLSRGAAFDTPLVVRLASNRSTVVRVPDTITIPAGAHQVEFYLDIIDNNVFDGPRTLTLSAAATDWTTGTTRVLVTDDESKPISPRSAAPNPSVNSS